MKVEELKSIVQGAQKLAWNHGGANTSGDHSAIIPILHRALYDQSPEILRAALKELAEEKAR